jgi:starch synthase
VRRTGGLVDTIVDADEATVRNGTATGFVFQEPSARALIDCLDRAVAYFDQPVIWRKLQRRAVSRDFSWDRSARRYLSLYRALAPHVTPAAADWEGDIGEREGAGATIAAG